MNIKATRGISRSEKNYLQQDSNHMEQLHFRVITQFENGKQGAKESLKHTFLQLHPHIFF